MKRLFLPLLLLCLLAFGCATCPDSPDAMRSEFKVGQALYEAGNYDEAFAVLKPMALLGYADAQYYVALMYNSGLGTTLYPQEGALYLYKAASKGQMEAMHLLAMAYEKANGVMPNTDMISYWTTRNAEAAYMDWMGWAHNPPKMHGQYFRTSGWKYGKWYTGQAYLVQQYWLQHINPTDDAKMLYQAAYMYERGIRVPANPQKASYMYQVLAMTENPYQADSQYQLGMMYQTGFGVEQNAITSRNWLQMAAAQGHQQAIAELQRIGAY